MTLWYVRNLNCCDMLGAPPGCLAELVSLSSQDPIAPMTTMRSLQAKAPPWPRRRRTNCSSRRCSSREVRINSMPTLKPLTHLTAANGTCNGICRSGKNNRNWTYSPAITFKILRYINSPVNGLQQEIRSIAHAMTLLGYDQLYRWLTLLLFASGKADPRSQLLLKNALV